MDVTLIVKASNQQCEDLTIKCEPSWTIRRLKGHLTEVYPGKPSTDEQKLIYSGQLLSDSVVLKDVLRQYDGQQAHTVHLVFTPKNSYYGGGGSSSGSSKSNANSKMVSNTSTSSGGTSGSNNGNGSNNSNSSTSVSSNASSYERSSREGVNTVVEANGDSLRHRSVSQARSTARTTPRQSQFVEHTAALQNFMQHTYMQYLNQYINLINEQSNANALYSGTGLPGAGSGAETAPATINPLAGNQPFPAVPFVPIVPSTAMAGGFPNFAYYPCMASAPYGSGFPAAGNIPTASSDANNAGSVTGALPGVPSGTNHFLTSSTHPSAGMGSGSASGSQIPGIVNPTASSSIESSDANAATTPATTVNGSESGTAAPAEQGTPQDAAPVAAAAAAPARARRFPNIVVEEQENNDWLDVFFSMCRVGILITVIYLYSSPMRCLTVLFIGVMLYLKKHLDRVYQAIDRRIPRLQAGQDANGAAQQEQQPAVAQPNNNVPEHNPEQQLPNDPNVGASGVESVAKTSSSETENATAGTSDASADASTSGRTIVPRPRTGSVSRSGAAPTAARTLEEEQQRQQQQTERMNSDGEPAAAEQPAAEGQRMTFNDMTSFLGTLVITFFTSIIPDTPAA